MEVLKGSWPDQRENNLESWNIHAILFIHSIVYMYVLSFFQVY